ncbi:MAG: hypothetical protein WC837_15325 [Bellilinea sp.]
MRREYRRKKENSLSIKEYACLNGFLAAIQRLPRSSNPHKNVWLDKTRHEWWILGWVSCHEKHLPYIVIKELCSKLGNAKFQKIQKQFQETGKLPQEAKELLKKI